MMGQMTISDNPTPPENSAAHSDFHPIATFDPVPALDHIFRQTAHRAISIAIWVITARIVFALWPRNFPFTVYLLPVAFACLCLAFAAAFISLTVARHRQESDREQKSMIWASLLLGAASAVWMFLPNLTTLFWRIF